MSFRRVCFLLFSPLSLSAFDSIHSQISSFGCCSSPHNLCSESDKATGLFLAAFLVCGALECKLGQHFVAVNKQEYQYG